MSRAARGLEGAGHVRLSLQRHYVATLKSRSSSLAIGYYVGKLTYNGLGLGAVTSTLLAVVIIGQLGITISPNVKSVFS